MDTYEEKISLLSEMMAFAVVDGELHDREYDFLWIIAQELEIEKSVFLELFGKRNEIKVIKDEHHRIMQFYRLALLMHCDGVLHDKEVKTINEIGINMGLNPMGIKKTLRAMQESPNQMIDPELLLCSFMEQHN